MTPKKSLIVDVTLQRRSNISRGPSHHFPKVAHCRRHATKTLKYLSETISYLINSWFLLHSTEFKELCDFVLKITHDFVWNNFTNTSFTFNRPQRTLWFCVSGFSQQFYQYLLNDFHRTLSYSQLSAKIHNCEFAVYSEVIRNKSNNNKESIISSPIFIFYSLFTVL